MVKTRRGGKRSSTNNIIESITKVKTHSGDIADLSENPLIYSDPAHGMSNAQIQAIKEFEEKNSNKRNECGIVLDSEGNVLAEKEGGLGMITMSRPTGTEIFGHIHSRLGLNEKGALGGTFSEGDINTFIKQAEKTMFASASEGRYSMTKGPKFNAQGLRDYSKRIHAQRLKECKERIKPYDEKFNNNEMKYGEYYKLVMKEFNKMLVELHNDFLAGQKDYGYSYGLERK